MKERSTVFQPHLAACWRGCATAFAAAGLALWWLGMMAALAALLMGRL